MADPSRVDQDGAIDLRDVIKKLNGRLCWHDGCRLSSQPGRLGSRVRRHHQCRAMTSGRRGSYKGDERFHISISTEQAVERIDQSILVHGWPGKRRTSIVESQERTVSPP